MLRHFRDRYPRSEEKAIRAVVEALLAADGPARSSMHPGPNPRPRERAVHMGKKPSEDRLGQQAAAALRDPGVRIHGVSVYVTDPTTWRSREFGAADVRELRTAFALHKTMGRGHYTVELPAPVTAVIARRFTGFFEWTVREEVQ